MKALCRDLGTMEYSTCWNLQQELFDALVARKRRCAPTDPRSESGGPNPAGAPETETDPAAEVAGTVLLVEHPPVYTLGKSGHAENLLVSREALEAAGGGVSLFSPGRSPRSRYLGFGFRQSSGNVLDEWVCSFQGAVRP